MTHALVLQVVVPMLSAPLCLLFRSGRVAALVAVVAALFGLVNSVSLLDSVREGGEQQYLLGGIPWPFGIEYRLDLLNAFVLVVISVVVAATTCWAALGARSELGRGRADIFFATWQLCVTGLMGIVVTADAFNVFVFLEISSLAGYALIAFGQQRGALVASFRYLLAGTVAATFILIGIGLLYMMTGTLNLHDLAARLPEVSGSRTVRAGWAFISVGLFLKAAIFPLHLWLPAAYATAPSAASSLLAGTATKVAVYLWLRFFFTSIAPFAPLTTLALDELLLGLGLIGGLVGSVAAIFQDDPKRMLAWSSIAQVGYLVVGISLGTTAGLNASLTLLLNHALVKTAAFLVLGTVALRLGRRSGRLRFRDFAGLGRRMPMTAAALVIAGAGLIGMPLTGGFLCKWLLIEALLQEGHWAAAVVMLLCSVLAAIYVWRLVEPMYFAGPNDAADEAGGSDGPAAAPASLLLCVGLAAPTWALCAASILIGLDTDFSVETAREAAEQLLLGAGR